MALIELPTLITIITTALIDSINPCAIGVLILLISTIILTKRKDKMLLIGLIYIAAVFIVYLAFGLGLIYFLKSIPIVISQYISIAVGTIVVGAGILEIKDYFWYSQGISLAIPAKYAEKIKENMRKISVTSVIFLGAFVGFPLD